MKLRLFLVPAVCLGVLVFAAVSARSQTVVTFDDLSDNASGAWFTSPYYGLNWINILHENSILSTSLVGLTGNYYGMVSPSNTAALFPGSEITSPGTNFNFLSAYLTGVLEQQPEHRGRGIQWRKRNIRHNRGCLRHEPDSVHVQLPEHRRA